MQSGRNVEVRIIAKEEAGAAVSRLSPKAIQQILQIIRNDQKKRRIVS